MRKVLVTPLSDRPSDGGVCFCCRRRDDGVGSLLGGKPPRIIWSCRDHIFLARKALLMPQRDYDYSENKALDAAGAAAGQYLDKIGKTDIGSLELHEWRKFCQTMIDAFGDDLAKRISSHEAPF